MIEVLRLGSELLATDDAAGHHNAVAALGDGRWIVNERVPLAIAHARQSLKFRRWGVKSPADLDLRYIGSSWHSGPEAVEKHFSPSQLADVWGLSVETIRRLFENEPDVLKMTNATGGTGRRRYKTLRIPASVVQRVHRRISA